MQAQSKLYKQLEKIEQNGEESEREWQSLAKMSPLSFCIGGDEHVHIVGCFLDY